MIRTNLILGHLSVWYPACLLIMIAAPGAFVDLEPGGEEEVQSFWQITTPSNGWAIFDNVDLYTEGTKPRNETGKVELQIKNDSGNFTTAAAIGISNSNAQWFGTFSPSGLTPPKWQVGNIGVGKEREARVKLFKKLSSGQYVEIDSGDGVRSGTITKT